MKRILLNESGTFYKINIVFCAELSEMNCRAELSNAELSNAELSAPNCPAPNCPGTHRASDTISFLERKVPDFNSPTEWPPNSPDLNPVDYSNWSVLQEKVYRSRIASVSKLKMHLINERGRFVQSIVDTALGQWRHRFSACVRGAGHTLSTKHKVSAILSCIYKKLLN